MDRFKLIMTQRDANQFRHMNVFVVPEQLEVTHQCWYIVLAGRYKSGVFQATATDPVLADAELTRGFIFPSNALHENGMGMLQ